MEDWKKVEQMFLNDDDKLKKKEKKKRYLQKKKQRWYQAKNNTNVYFEGFGPSITAEEVEQVFLKCGGIRLDPDSGEKRIKLYKNDDG